MNQRNKYLVAFSRGAEAYEEAFDQTPLETQRAMNHDYGTQDKDFAELIHEAKEQVRKARTTETNVMLDANERGVDLHLAKVHADFKKVEPFQE